MDRKVTDEFVRGMSGGVPIMGRVTKKCLVERTGEKEFRIVLRQGLNRQIRRMCGHFGYTVLELKRVRVMNIELGDLKTGRYRDLTDEERRELFRELGL